MSRRIFLIAGHNGSKTGADGFLDEGQETIELCKSIHKNLEELGIECNSDINAHEKSKLSDIVKWLKSEVQQDDICIDVHFNASSSVSANGTEALVSSNASKLELYIADTLCEIVCTILATRNRGVKKESQSARGKLAMLSGFNCNQVILEICFCTNEQDVIKYNANKDKLAKQLARTLKTISLLTN